MDVQSAEGCFLVPLKTPPIFLRRIGDVDRIITSSNDDASWEIIEIGALEEALYEAINRQRPKAPWSKLNNTWVVARRVFAKVAEFHAEICNGECRFGVGLFKPGRFFESLLVGVEVLIDHPFEGWILRQLFQARYRDGHHISLMRSMSIFLPP
jgi:hypothetical protein